MVANLSIVFKNMKTSLLQHMRLYQNQRPTELCSGTPAPVMFGYCRRKSSFTVYWLFLFPCLRYKRHQLLPLLLRQLQTAGPTGMTTARTGCILYNMTLM